MNDKQFLLLVDDWDTFSGKYAEKERCHYGKGLHHRGFVILLQNDKGEVLLQKRKHKLWDGYWDVSAISHVLHLTDHDETYEEAAARSLKREMGIINVSVKKIGGFNYFVQEEKYCENEYCAILIGEYNKAVKPNKDVVYEYKWLSRKDFLTDMKNKPQKYTPWANLAIGELFVPTHVALIMDGNRRWASVRRLPISAGHLKATERLEPLIMHAKKCGVGYLTFWAFSTENWNRDRKEVELLMTVFRRFFKSSSIEKLKKNDVCIKVLGELDPFPKDIVKDIREIVEETKNNKSITVNMGLNYGGRAEILRAVKKMLVDKPKEITEEMFSQYLYTKGQPDPDLIIRPGGEQRLSGFLPWQSVYSEFYFTKTYWPDFNERELDKALEEYALRERRFGK